MFDLGGKVALVTGGNGGIGYGMAEALANAGADVVLWGTNEAKSADAIEKLRESGRRVLAQRVDVTDEAAVVRGMAEAIEAMGRLDCVIANAGMMGEMKPLVEYSAEDFRKVTALNLEGAFFTLREACRHMIVRAQAGDTSGGSLIGISSIAAFHGSARMPAYGASKGAMLSFIRAIAVEHARYGIRANCIHPGFIATDMSAVMGDNPAYAQTIRRVPMRRLGRPAEFGGIAVYLASDAASFHTGDSIVIDGGYTVF